MTTHAPSGDVRLPKTQITDKIRVSSAAIHYPHDAFGERWQFETWIFSDDPRQCSRHVIHGSASRLPAAFLEAKTLRIHESIVRCLREKFPS